MRKIFLCFLCVLFAFQACTKKENAVLQVDTAVRIGTLDNGLKYYIRNNNWPENRADFYIVQKVGSIQEKESQRGLAHFLEHMCFNGTDNFKGNDLIRYCETLGVKFGRDLNAYTSIDETVYNISNVPTTRESALDSCLLILHDWADGLTLDPEEIDKERGVIHEEWRMRTSANSRMLERNLPKLYPGSKYGLRYPIGLMSVVDGCKPKELRDYYQKWYHPSNQGIIVVGDVDVDKVEAQIQKLFGNIKNPENMLPVVSEPVPDNKEPIVIIDKDKEQSRSIIEVMFKHNVFPDSLKGNMGYVIHNYMKNAALGMLNARLGEIAQKPDCPFVGASVSDGSYIFAKTKNAFRVAAAPKDISQTAVAIKAALVEAHRAVEFGFTETEYNRLKANNMSALDKAFKSRDKRSNGTFASEYKGNYLSNEPIPAFEDFYQKMKEIIPQIPLDSINNVLRKLLSKSDENLVILNFNNEKEGTVYPTKEQLIDAVHTARTEKLTPYIDDAKNEPLIAKMPSLGRITEEKDSDKFGYKVLKLSNGITVILKKTDYKKDVVSISGTGFGGKSLYGEKDYTNLKVFNSVIGFSGLGNFSSTELSKVLAGKIANANLSMGDKYMGLSGASTPKDIETMFQLTYLYFTDIKKDTKIFNNQIESWKIGLKNRHLSPNVAASDSLTATVYGHNPRLKPLLLKDLEDINYDRILEIAKERTANASSWIFTIIGNYDEETIRPLICKYLASLPTKGKVERGHLVRSFQKGVIDNEFTRKMETPKTASYMFWHTTDIPYSWENAIKISMIGQILDMVYTKKIREEASAAYSCSVQAGATLEEEYHDYTLLVTCPMKPEKKDIALKIMKEEVLNMTHTCDEAMLEKVKEYMLKNAEDALKTNSYWASVIATYHRYGIDTHTDYKKLVSKQTTRDLCEFMKEILASKNQISVVMMPK